MSEMSKPTPGPWTFIPPMRFEDGGEDDGAYFYPGGIEGADGDPVCEFGTLAGSGAMFENPYNPPLIATAPEMLSVLKRLDAFWMEDFPSGPIKDAQAKEGTLTRIMTGSLSDDTVAIWSEIRAVIAKAEGNQCR
jgi:hypothetical protein